MSKCVEELVTRYWDECNYPGQESMRAALREMQRLCYLDAAQILESSEVGYLCEPEVAAIKQRASDGAE
jgi:hypothetical protein